MLGWLTGIFDALRRRPRFRVQAIDGPTFCSTFMTGKEKDGYQVHRSAFALYLHVTNIGSSSGSIDDIHIGYHWNVHRFSPSWFRYGLGWFWLKNQTVAVEDFQVYIGENLKIYPFLVQRNFLSSANSNTFLEIGQSTNGVVYFEQSDSWGACFPLVRDGKIRVKVRVIDAFGKRHVQKLRIPSVTPEEARKFNPAFGTTIAHLRGEMRGSGDEAERPGEGSQ